MRPIYKWASGKKRSLGMISDSIGVIEGTYYEPFFGGGSVFFGIEPRSSVIGDKNPAIARTLIGIRDYPIYVESMLRELCSLDSEDFFYKIRDDWNASEDALEVDAARFLYLNRACFNGLWRVNSVGKFNVSYGRKNAVHPMMIPDILGASRLLQCTRIMHGDYAETCSDASHGDTMYLDPPYLGTFVDYTSSGWTISDMIELESFAIKMVECGVRVVVSLGGDDVTRNIWSRWNVRDAKSRRSIGCNANSRIIMDDILVDLKGRR